jgi:hypothetical protein
VLKILEIKETTKKIAISPLKGKNQYIRSVKWNGITFISVPHIGSQRMRTFWNNNIDQVKEAVAAL